MTKSLDKVVVCTDSEEIANTCSDFNIEVTLTSSSFQNGTERIASVIENYNYDYVVDIQGDEPLVNPDHIDIVAESISKNLKKEDIIIPTLEVPYSVPETIARVQTFSGRIMTLTEPNFTDTQFLFQQFKNIYLSLDLRKKHYSNIVN